MPGMEHQLAQQECPGVMGPGERRDDA